MNVFLDTQFTSFDDPVIVRLARVTEDGSRPRGSAAGTLEAAQILSTSAGLNRGFLRTFE